MGPEPAGSADLHVHSTHSDGACSPALIVRAAANLRLAAVAITDHDTVSAAAVARPEAARLGVELVAGVELTAERDGREIHLLGHFVRDDHPELVATCARLRLERDGRAEAIVGRLAGLGLRVDLDSVRAAFPRAAIGRKHLAEFLFRTGQVDSTRDAFDRYLADGRPADLPRPRLPWAEGIALIRRAGGVAGLAHPPYDLRESTLRDYAEAGLASVEVAGPGIRTRLGLRWRAWADALGLIPIAGSDFHDHDRPGRWVGAVTTPAEDLERLRRRRPADP